VKRKEGRRGEEDGPSCAGGRRRIRALRIRSCGCSLWNIVRLGGGSWGLGLAMGRRGGWDGRREVGLTEEGFSGFARAFGLWMFGRGLVVV